MSWGSKLINDKKYSVVRVSLIKREGKHIHKEPMLLISTLRDNISSLFLRRFKDFTLSLACRTI